MSRSGRSRDDPFAFLRRADTTLVRAEPPPPVTVTRYAEIGPEATVDGTWRLKTRLGHGAFGVVYEAARVDDPEDYVAIKLIAPEPGGDDDPWARRVMQEVEVATSLRHPNIVHTRAHGRLADGSVYLVMELLEGETLRDRLVPQQGLPWPELAAICRQLGAALGAAHDAGIVHRDVKPSNVLLVATDDPAPRVTLIDFGLCKGPAVLTASLELMGTAPYIAPEIFAHGARAATPAVDVYGLALVAYELVTGRRGFDAPSVPELVAWISRGPGPTAIASLRPDASAALVAEIEAGLAREPGARPCDAAEYGRRLAAAAG